MLGKTSKIMGIYCHMASTTIWYLKNAFTAYYKQFNKPNELSPMMYVKNLHVFMRE
jgi:hypothetical protein